MNEGGNDDIYGIGYGFGHGAGADSQPKFVSGTGGSAGAVINRCRILPGCLIKERNNPMNKYRNLKRLSDSLPKRFPKTDSIRTYCSCGRVFTQLLKSSIST